MAEFLVIRLDADPDAHASWIVVDSDGTRRSPPAAGPLSEAPAQTGNHQVIVLVPAGDVSTFTVDLPARGARLRAALPFALEEHVAEEVEDLHFVAGKRLANGKLPVAVVAHEKMAEWLSRLDEAGISADQLVPESHGLALVPNTLSLLFANGTAMFNDGVDMQFVMHDVGPVDVLSALGVIDGHDEQEEDEASRHLLVYGEPEIESRFDRDWISLRSELDSVDINLLPDGPLPRLAVTVASGVGVNLLQGRYGEKTDVGALIRPWKWAAILLVSLSVLGLAGKAVDYYRLTVEEAALKEQFTSEYRRIRPTDTREVMDPIGTVTSLRRSIGGPTAAAPVFLPSLQELASALAANDAAEVSVITYRAGVVDVRLSVPDVATLDQIQKSISESMRFDATIRSTDRVGDRVNSQIQIRETGT